MSVAISELTIEWAQYRPKKEKGDAGTNGFVCVSRDGVVIKAPHPGFYREGSFMVAYRDVEVDPADLDALILALQRAKDLGRQMFNSDVKP